MDKVSQTNRYGDVIEAETDWGNLVIRLRTSNGSSSSITIVTEDEAIFLKRILMRWVETARVTPKEQE